jgi:hypothetical protein
MPQTSPRLRRSLGEGGCSQFGDNIIKHMWRVSALLPIFQPLLMLGVRCRDGRCPVPNIKI